MRRRNQKTPWIHRCSRYVIGAIATVGAFGTAYLTIVKFMGGTAACPTDGCDRVLSSPYATVFGLPLTIFGFLAYASMLVLSLGPLVVNPETQKELRTKLEEWSWFLLFMVASAMTIFSAYLMYVLVTDIKAVCLYCIASATMSLTMLIVTLIGRTWDDVGQLAFTGALVAMVTLVGTLGVYSGVNSGADASSSETTATNGTPPPPIQTTSGEAEIQLAKYLTDHGIKMYGAYWCPHCHDQEALFGREAFALIDYVECDPGGANADPEACQAAGVEGYPTWKINGENYSGTRPLSELASLSGYQGPQDFKN